MATADPPRTQFQVIRIDPKDTAHLGWEIDIPISQPNQILENFHIK